MAEWWLPPCLRSGKKNIRRFTCCLILVKKKLLFVNSSRSARAEEVNNNKVPNLSGKSFPSFARDRAPIQNTKQLSELRSHARTSCTRDTTGSIEELGSYFLALLIDSSRGLTTNERAIAAAFSLAPEYPSGCDVVERHEGGVITRTDWIEKNRGEIALCNFFPSSAGVKKNNQDSWTY